MSLGRYKVSHHGDKPASSAITSSPLWLSLDQVPYLNWLSIWGYQFESST